VVFDLAEVCPGDYERHKGRRWHAKGLSVRGAHVRGTLGRRPQAARRRLGFGVAKLDTKRESAGAEFLVLGRMLIEGIDAFKAYDNQRGVGPTIPAASGAVADQTKRPTGLAVGLFTRQ
jgi:hypothetical protein